MKALILAAGTGNRLGKFTDSRPKTLVKVAGLAMIDWIFAFLRHPAVSQIGIVGGYEWAKLRDHVADYFRRHTLPVPPAFFENRHFQKGSILSLTAAFPFLDDDVLILNSDHIYPPPLLDHILSQAGQITAMCDFNRRLGDDDMKVQTDDRRRLTAIHKKLADFDGGYIGLTYCAKESLTIYVEGVEMTRRRHGDTAPVEWVLGELVRENHPVRICDTSAYVWHEVDTPSDLAKADEALAKGWGK